MATGKGLLEGHVEYRLNLGPSNSARKKQRTASVKSAISTRNHAVDDPRFSDISTSLPEAGYYLVVANPATGQNDTYLLSVPHQLLKTVCDAARFRGRLRVSKYNRIHLNGGGGGGGGGGPSPTRSMTTDDLESRKRQYPDSGTFISNNATTQAALLEIHNNGLELLDSNPKPAQSQSKQQTAVILTLDQVFQAETEKAKEDADEKRDRDKIEVLSNNDDNKKSEGRKRRRRPNNRYSFQATVDSISPIIFLDEPFALMELYDDEAATLSDHHHHSPQSCVVVFQGLASLACHGGIFPGDLIRLLRCKRQRWKTPEVVTKHKAWHLKGRIPSHVFVLQDPKDIIWPELSAPCDSLPQTISTPIPLVSLQGEVVSSEWASLGSSPESSYMMHAVEIKSLIRPPSNAAPDSTSKDEIPAARYILFLTYYPMSPSLALTLRRGAIVLGINIHCLGSSFVGVRTNSKNNNNNSNNNSSSKQQRIYYYGACLRSTVTILQVPPVSNKASSAIARELRHPLDQQPSVCSQHYPSRPYKLLSVRRTYLEYACRKGIHAWFYDKDNFSRPQEHVLPAFNAVAKLFWTHFTCTNTGNHHSPNKRNPYMEFFDHAGDDECENNVGLEDGGSATESPQPLLTGGCHCSRTHSMRYDDDNTQHPLLPCWIPLHELQDDGIRLMQERLTEALDGQMEHSNPPIGKPHVGWTASVDLKPSVFVNHQTEKEENGDIQVIYTGGKISENSDRNVSSGGQLLSTLLENNHCVLPAQTPVHDARQSQSNQNLSASFAFGQLDGVVVSCFCVKALSGEGAQNSSVGNQKYPGNLQSSAADNSAQKKTYATNGNGQVYLQHQNKLRGACILWKTAELLFVISVQLRFKTLVPVPTAEAKTHVDCSQLTTKSSNICSRQSLPISLAVQQCLDPEVSTTLNGEEKNKQLVIGVLTRQRLRPSKITNNRYRGFGLTLNHIPITIPDGYGYQDISTPQSIEVKTEIHLTDLGRKKHFLKEQFRKTELSTLDVTDGVSNLVLAWWKLADSSDSCALTCSGWDDRLRSPTAGSSQDFAVIVQLPGTAVLKIEARGYQRFSGRMSQIHARFLRVRSDQDLNRSVGVTRQPMKNRATASSQSALLLDSVGGLRFLPGQLDRRQLRRIRQVNNDYINNGQRQLDCSSVEGERMRSPSTELSGIPECNLQFLIRCVCLDLRRRKHSLLSDGCMAPSLVRKVSGARLLGISFCQVQVSCTKCYQSLRQQTQKEKQQQEKQQDRRPHPNHEKRQQEYPKQPSYWHVPLPDPGTPAGTAFASLTKARLTNKIDTPPQRDDSPMSARAKSRLCCPNGCDVDAFAEVKWECSGTLDDGTAQGKLYSERQAARMLLAMPQETVDWVEEGAWMHHKGRILFSKIAPPPSHLAKAVEAANMQYASQEREHRQRRRRLGKNGRYPEPYQAARVLDLMEPVDRAFYLMYTHCRHAKEATRAMDYLVRCKPLSDTILHLNHSEIDVVAPGAQEGTLSSHHSATYSLPPLKMILVDACVPKTSSSGAILVEETWDLIESLRQKNA